MGMLAEIASMYYEQNMTQTEIAEIFCISRSRISRLLKTAREKDVVKVQINYPGERAFELEDFLQRKYKLHKAIVLNDAKLDYAASLCEMGKFAAEYFEENVENGMVVGISWGRSLAQMVKALRGNQELSLEIIQIIGGMMVENRSIDIPELIMKMTTRFAAKGFRLNAPLYIKDDSARETLKRLPIIDGALFKARNADMVVTGIGNVSDDTFSFMWGDHDADVELEELRRNGAVGFICAQAYDVSGEEIQNGFNQRIIGLSLNELRKIKTVIGISGGKQKAAAVLGALRGRYVNVLVTDRSCAQEMLRLEK